MRLRTSSFQCQRLTQARNSRGLTQVSLGLKINKTASTISRWESGEQSPEHDALKELSDVLKVPVTFFTKPLLDYGGNPLFFRSMAATTKSLRNWVETRLHWAQEISYNLQEWVDLPEVNIPSLNVDDINKIQDNDIEEKAKECRKLWGIGLGPISDVLLVIENSGIIVVKEKVGATTMDGLSNWSCLDNRPYIYIAEDKNTCVRSRMDAAHELGHLILHKSIKPKSLNKKEDFKEIERQAFHFASEFLMPTEPFADELAAPSLDNFLFLKERWKISVAAMIMRCKYLDIISEEYGQKLWKSYNSKGWRKQEPLDDVLIPEEPRLLCRSVKLLVDEKIFNVEELINNFKLSPADIEALTRLPRGYMNDKKDSVIDISVALKKKVNTDSLTSLIEAGEIIDFPTKDR